MYIARDSMYIARDSMYIARKTMYLLREIQCTITKENFVFAINIFMVKLVDRRKSREGNLLCPKT